MRRTISTPIVAAFLLLWPSVAAAQGWGPPPPDAPVRGEDETEPVAVEPEAAPAPAPETPEPAADTEEANPVAAEPEVEGVGEPEAPDAEAAAREDETGDDDERDDDEREDGESEESWVRRLARRFEFHGYSRMPISFMFQPVHGETGGEGEEDEGARVRLRTPYLVSNDYYLSGFAYLRHQETDWSELFLTANLHDDVSITVGAFASLYSDWSYVSTETQFGLAQAYLTWRDIAGVEPLWLRVGVFWDKLGHIRPYDTYVFGRTHHWGLQLGWDFSNGAQVRIGGGAHLERADQNQGYTPLIYAYGGTPIGPVTVNTYIIGLWTNDVRPFTIIEEGHLVVFGGDVRVDFPWFDGPLYIALAGYWAEHALFLANAFELLHSTGGRGLTENFFGLQGSDSGTGSMIVGGLDWPVTIWRGLYARLYGMLAHVWLDEALVADLEEPSATHDRTYLKWGLEAGYQVLRWLRVGLVYDRVILDMNQPELGFRGLTPRVVFTPYRDVEIELTYTHYWYGDDVHLRPNQVPGETEPDEDVFHIMAEASW
jgi:hypothetical protein